MTATLPDSLSLQLDAIAATVSDSTPAQLAHHAGALAAASSWCARALGRHHLVTVAATLVERLRTDLEGLQSLGVPTDILQEFPAWRGGSREGFRPKALGLRPAPAGAADPVGTLRLQLSPSSGSIPYSLSLLRGLMRRMDPSVRFVVVVEPGADLDALARLTHEFFSPRAAGQVRFVELPCITVFAQDNARAAVDARGRAVLMVPRSFGRGSERQKDELDPAEAERAFGIPVVRTRLLWEGGNIIYDGHHCLVGADTVAQNMARLGLSARETLALLAADLGSEVTLLGDVSSARFDPERGNMASSGQASFHIDLDVSLLGAFGRARRPRALVADAARGLDLLPAVMRRASLFSGRFLPPKHARDFIRSEYQAYARQRHPRLLAYAATLERLGYRVFGVPDLRIDPDENVFASVNLDFGYCNVLPGLRRGRPAAHYLPWGIPALDDAAEGRFRAAGVEPVRVGTPAVANALMQLQGGLHCFCGKLA
jgi:hypothetical protein